MTIRRGSAAGDKVTTIRRALAQDEELSYRALGVITHVLSKPADWTTDAVKLSRGRGREGEKAIRAALREAERRGYLLRRRRQVPAGGEKIDGQRVRGGAWVTDWEITDDPSTLWNAATTERQKRPVGQRPPGQPPDGARAAGGRPAPDGTAGAPPGVLDRDTEERHTPTSPGAAELAEAVVVVVREAGMKQPPGLGVATDACAKLRAYSWDVPTLERAAREHDWTGARAGAVIAWLRGLTGPPPAVQIPAARPAHCGHCDPGTRLLLDDNGRPRRGQPCPTCGGTP